MALNEQPDSDMIDDQNFSPNSTRSDATQPRSIQTDPGMSPRELLRRNLTKDISLNRQIRNVDTSLRRISYKYEIHPRMIEHLRKLQNFEIVIVCDDSGSMLTPVAGSHGTRWNELCSIVKIIVEIGVIFDSNGVDIYFLNRESFHNVKDLKVVEEVFTIPPNGYTPLVPVLKEIFESQLARPGRDKQLLVFVATDGEPTDKDDNPNVPELERLLREKRRVDTTYVSFLLCTDNPASVKYLNEWDQKMEHVDVTDDFISERNKIHQHCGENYHFSHGDYVVKALVGAIVPDLDIIDEPH